MWRQPTTQALSPADRTGGRARLAILCGIGFWVLGACATALDNWADPGQRVRHLTDLTSLAIGGGLLLGVVGFVAGVGVIGTRMGKVAVAITVAPMTAAICLLLIMIGELLNKYA